MRRATCHRELSGSVRQVRGCLTQVDADGFPAQVPFDRERNDAGAAEGDAQPGAELVEVAIPTPGDDEVLVRVHGASICGTDLHMLEWNEWADKRIGTLPLTFGHEVAGTVHAVGDEVHHLRPGAFVAAETHIACGHCSTCQTGRAHICENLRILGVDTDGAFAEYVVLPAQNAWVVGEGIDPDVASIMEPFGNAVHAAFGTGGGEDIATNAVAVIGCGPIGMFAVGVVRSLGAFKVIAVEPNDYRRAKAEEMGADVSIDPTEVDPVVAVLEQTKGAGAEVVLEMSGNATAIDQGTRMLARGGRMSLLGLPDASVDAGPERPGDLQGSATAGHHRAGDVPDLATDDNPALDGARRRLTCHHPSIRFRSVAGGVRDHSVGPLRQGDPRSGGWHGMTACTRFPEGELAALDRDGLLLHPRTLEGPQGARARYDGRE